MTIKFYLILIAAVALTIPLAAQSVISVVDFGAMPGDTMNDRMGIQRAVDYCRQHGKSKLLIPAGTYKIREAKAVQLMQDIMSFKMGKNPQDVVYTPYYPYTKGIELRNIHGLEIDAQGAVFLVEGWMEPLSIQGCSGITITGLTIDYKTPPHSEGLVTAAGSDYFDVKFERGMPVTDNFLMTRIMFWDPGKGRLLGNTVYFPQKNERLDSNTVRVRGSHPQDIVGTVALANHTMHFRPAILILESIQTVLNQVTIHAQPGMGIVGHRCNGILMKGLRVVPRPGSFQSTNTDATHFTSCKGTIRFEGCMFEGQGDDATNVHGYYQVIKEKVSEKTYDIQMEKAWGTHAMVLDYPDKGDHLELVSKRTLEVVGIYKVVKTDTFRQAWKARVRLDRTVAGNIEDYYLINVTRLPRLEFVNSTVHSHLARAVLVKTRNVLIENCVFRETTGTAIHIGAEGDWREGAGSQNVVIRNNRILRCGSGDAVQDNACAIAINVKAPDISATEIHTNIVIEGNLIEGENTNYGISVSGATEVFIRNNIFSNCSKPWNIKYAGRIVFENNYNTTDLIR